MEEKQFLKSVHYHQLKNLIDLDLNLEGKNVTGIFGPNGYGKSTILHSILCLYQAQKGSVDHRFSEYFKTDAAFNYTGSKIEMHYEFDDETHTTQSRSRLFNKKSSHWIRSYSDRPARPVYFIGIESCVPSIEVEKDKRQYINTVRDAASVIDKKESILRKASYIMNRSYIDVYFSKSSRRGSSYLTYEIAGGLKYKSLSMGAGEQRLFKILSTIYRVPQYSLIIIDEIDLTLHTAALNKMMEVLVDVASDRHLQIVFTSHREELTKRTDINVRHIFQTATKTMCLHESRPECMDRLTGIALRTLDIFVEDDLAETIVSKCLQLRNINKRAVIHKFGSAFNAFVVSTGLHINGTLSQKTLIVLDGDVYVTDPEKKAQIEKIYTGNEPDKVIKRGEALSHITQFNVPAGKAPEEYIWEQLNSSVYDNEIIRSAKAINAVADTHTYVDRIIDDLGIDRYVALDRIIEQMTHEPCWNGYVANIMNWIDERFARGDV